MRRLFALPGNEALAEKICAASAWRLGRLDARRFPDGESHVQLRSEVEEAETAILCTLARPDSRFLRLVYAARLLRESGARSVKLIAPYLAYMRQDDRFHPGETVTARHFADLISREFDGLITVDPHLHRVRELGEIYSIPTIVLHAAPLLAGWIKHNVSDPFLLGPDSESEQWVAGIAEQIGSPFAVFEKQRFGDRSVKVAAPDLSRWRDRNPVFVDDVVSSGTTVIEASLRLSEQGLMRPSCAVVHALFPESVRRSLAPHVSALVSTDTVPHSTNAVSVAPILAAALEL